MGSVDMDVHRGLHVPAQLPDDPAIDLSLRKGQKKDGFAATVDAMEHGAPLIQQAPLTQRSLSV